MVCLRRENFTFSSAFLRASLILESNSLIASLSNQYKIVLRLLGLKGIKHFRYLNYQEIETSYAHRPKQSSTPSRHLLDFLMIQGL